MGNITQLSDGVSGETVTYEYDGLYRLTRIDSTNDLYGGGYSYDAVGNRLTQTVQETSDHYRHNPAGCGSILLTPNKGIKDWPERFAGDEVLATAILDRLLHRSYVLKIAGRSYRLKDLEQAVSLHRE